MKVPITILLLLLLCACQKVADNEKTAEKGGISSKYGINHIVIDEGDIQKPPPLSSLTQEYQFIKLEDCPECLVGEIYKIVEHRGKIYLLDRFTQRKVSVFSENGNFLYQLGNIGKGPGEFNFPYDLVPSSEGGEMLLLCDGRINRYNIDDGTFLGERPIAYPAVRLAALGNAFAFEQGRSKPLVLIADNNLSIVSEHFANLDVRTEWKATQGFQIDSGNATLYYRPLCDTIYRISREGPEPAVLIDFGEKRFDENVFESLSESSRADVRGLLGSIGDYMTDIRVYTQTREHTYFNFGYRSSGYCVVYDNRNSKKIVFEYRDIKNDVTYEPQMVNILSANHEGFFMGYILDMHSVKDKLQGLAQEEQNRFARELSSLLEQTDMETGNPVIFKFKFKPLQDNDI